MKARVNSRWVSNRDASDASDEIASGQLYVIDRRWGGALQQHDDGDTIAVL